MTFPIRGRRGDDDCWIDSLGIARVPFAVDKLFLRDLQLRFRAREK